MTALLLLDTSLAGVSVALLGVDGDRVGTEPLWYGAHRDNAGSVSAISGLVERGLSERGMSRLALAGLAVSVGPGTFTGIKVGLAFGYGLVSAWPVPLPTLGLSALECAAGELAKEHAGAFALFLPATRTHGFVVVSGAPARLVDVGEGGDLAPLLATLPDAAALAVAGRWPLLSEMARGVGRSVLEIAPSEVCRQGIYGMALRVARAWPGGFGQSLPQPNYLRLSTAEERLVALQKAAPAPPLVP